MSLFTLNLNLFTIISLLFIFSSPIFLIKKRSKKWIYSFLSVYILALIFGVFSDIKVKENTMFFSLFIDKKWGNASLNTAYINSFNILVNLFLLFPIGTFFPLLTKKKSNFFIKIVIIGLITSSLIETLQFILPINRSPEILDLVTNTISAILGYLYFLFITTVLFRGEKYDKLSQQKNYTNK